MIRFALLSTTLWLFATPLALAADPPTIDRTIKKEPAYKTKSPKYALLVFGAEAKDRVWLVQDGDTLHVDRNGNGDLTEPGDAVAAKKPGKGETSVEGAYAFEIGDLTVGGKTHKGFSVGVEPLSNYNHVPSFAQRPEVKAALAKDPKASVFALRGDVEVPGMKGGGLAGRLSYVAGNGMSGVLQFTAKPADAPVIHLGGPLEITFGGDEPSLRVGRSTDFILVVGTPGFGPGTFATLLYEDTIPDTAKPALTITYQPAKPGDPPLKEHFEIKERC